MANKNVKYPRKFRNKLEKRSFRGKKEVQVTDLFDLPECYHRTGTMYWKA